MSSLVLLNDFHSSTILVKIFLLPVCEISFLIYADQRFHDFSIFFAYISYNLFAWFCKSESLIWKTLIQKGIELYSPSLHNWHGIIIFYKIDSKLRTFNYFLEENSLLSPFCLSVSYINGKWVTDLDELYEDNWNRKCGKILKHFKINAKFC